MVGWINVKDHGASGDGSTNDTNAVVAALQALPAAGGVVYFPPGKYLLTRRIDTPTDRHVSLRGDGYKISLVVWDCAVGGIRHAPDAVQRGHLQVRGLGLQTKRVLGGYAIEGVWPELEGWYALTFTAKDLEIRGETVSECWTTGIKLTGGRKTVIRDVSILGLYNSNPTKEEPEEYLLKTTGIHLHSAESSCDYRISSVHIQQVNAAVHVTEATPEKGPEGITVEQSHMVLVGHGVVVSTHEPMTNICNSHISAVKCCILSDAIGSTIIGCHLHHRRHGADGKAGAGIWLKKPLRGYQQRNVHIAHNDIRGHRMETTGIIVDDHVHDSFILGNTIVDQMTGVWLRSGSTHCIVRDNLIDWFVNSVVNQGVGHIVRDNLMLHRQLLIDRRPQEARIQRGSVD